MKISILGCGSSVGVPVIGCKCQVCCSGNTKNNRTRASVMIEDQDTVIVVDASSDFKTQMFRKNASYISALLMTHCHADHSSGLSDVVVLKTKDGKKIPFYTDILTMNHIVAGFSYFFVPKNSDVRWGDYGWLNPVVITPYNEYRISDNITFVPIMQNHGEIHSIGYIFNKSFAYCTDVKVFPEKSFDMLRNIDLLILSCTKYKETSGHAAFADCMDWIAELKPKMSVLTHMSHDFDYDLLADQLSSLPCKVVPAYDGMMLFHPAI